MDIWKIIKREISYKKYGFITGILSLIIATAGFIGAIILLRSDEIATEQMFIQKEKELKEEMLKLEDDYRLIMRKMGYNVLIIHKDQSLAELEQKGYPTTYLNFDDVWKIAESGIKTLNHLLPVLQEKVYWEERKIEIFLTGIQGQVPVYSKPGHLTQDHEYRSPIMERVPEGKADMGEEIAILLNLRPGDKIKIKGELFEVNRIYPRKGTKDDLNIWIPMDKAQKILNRKGEINGILALECVCATEMLGQLKEEVKAILPHTQVFEFSSLIAARADVRKRAAELHKKIMSDEVAHQLKLRNEKEKLASILVIILIAGASVWIFFLVMNNVRERRHETGILRAIGFKRYQVLKIFLGKTLLMGIIGGILGSITGLWLGVLWSDIDMTISGFQKVINLSVILPGLLLSPVIALAAGLIPSVMAANNDPATMLNEQ